MQLIESNFTVKSTFYVIHKKCINALISYEWARNDQVTQVKSSGQHFKPAAAQIKNVERTLNTTLKESTIYKF